jgi:LSD1 subclass zinc finger protein
MNFQKHCNALLEMILATVVQVPPQSNQGALIGPGQNESVVDRPLSKLKEVTQDLARDFSRMSTKVLSAGKIFLNNIKKKEDSDLIVARAFKPADGLVTDYVRMDSQSTGFERQNVSTMQGFGPLSESLISNTTSTEANGPSASEASPAPAGNGLPPTSSGASPLPPSQTASGVPPNPHLDKSLVVCISCKRQLAYDGAASVIQCAVCKTVQPVGPAAGPAGGPYRVVRCHRCPTAMMWPLGAHQVLPAPLPPSAVI